MLFLSFNLSLNLKVNVTKSAISSFDNHRSILRPRSDSASEIKKNITEKNIPKYFGACLSEPKKPVLNLKC